MTWPILIAGPICGALVLLAFGHLLQSDWLPAVRRPLVLGAWASPLLLPLAWLAALPRVALLAVPVVIGLGFLLARRQRQGWLGGVSLLVLVPAIVAAMQMRVTEAGNLAGVALLVQHAVAAMALSVLFAGPPDDAGRTGIERLLLSLGLAVLWLWFVQFVVIYAADLPREAAWYLGRNAGAMGWLQSWLALPALLLAVGLALVPQWRRWRLVGVSLLLLVQYAANLAWLLA